MTERKRVAASQAPMNAALESSPLTVPGLYREIRRLRVSLMAVAVISDRLSRQGYAKAVLGESVSRVDSTPPSTALLGYMDLRARLLDTRAQNGPDAAEDLILDAMDVQWQFLTDFERQEIKDDVFSVRLFETVNAPQP